MALEMKKSFLRLRSIVDAVLPDMKTEWEVPFDGDPCVFVGNHCGLLGPLDMIGKFELRDDTAPWFNAACMFPKEVPAYVRQDYWWKPGCFLEPLFNATLPYLAVLVLPPVLRTVPGVPVYHDMRVMTTMRQSIRLLKEGNNLLIFPEQPSGWKSHHTWINTGFLQLAPMLHKATGKALKFWPVHIDHKNHVIRVSAPIAYDPQRTVEEQTEDFTRVLAAGLRGEPVPECKTNTEA